MAKILIVGGYSDDDGDAEEVADFGTCLGREVAEQGHTLLSACLTDFDRDVFSIPDDDILETQVDLAIVGGAVKFRRETA